MIYIDIILICIFWICVSDILKFGEDMEQMLSRHTGRQVTLNKIFKCSTCEAFWVSMLYLIITSNLSILNVTVALFIAVNGPIILDIIRLFQDMVIKLNNSIRGWFRL